MYQFLLHNALAKSVGVDIGKSQAVYPLYLLYCSGYPSNTSKQLFNQSLIESHPDLYPYHSVRYCDKDEIKEFGGTIYGIGTLDIQTSGIIINKPVLNPNNDYIYLVDSEYDIICSFDFLSVGHTDGGSVFGYSNTNLLSARDGWAADIIPDGFYNSGTIMNNEYLSRFTSPQLSPLFNNSFHIMTIFSRDADGNLSSNRDEIQRLQGYYYTYGYLESPREIVGLDSFNTESLYLLDRFKYILGMGELPMLKAKLFDITPAYSWYDYNMIEFHYVEAVINSITDITSFYMENNLLFCLVSYTSKEILTEHMTWYGPIKKRDKETYVALYYNDKPLFNEVLYFTYGDSRLLELYHLTHLAGMTAGVYKSKFAFRSSDTYVYDTYIWYDGDKNVGYLAATDVNDGVMIHSF